MRVRISMSVMRLTSNDPIFCLSVMPQFTTHSTGLLTGGWKEESPYRPRAKPSLIAG
jgi:hypothetical protein